MRIRLASSAPLDAPRPRTRKNVNPSRIIVSTFALAILLGTALLSLPAAAAGGAALSWLDALFLATSAVCVTGMSLFDIGETLSPFGTCVVLALVQIGGLGIMTLSCSFLLLLGRRLCFRDQLVVKESFDRCRISSLRGLITSIVLTTLAFECAVALVLGAHFRRAYDYAPLRAISHGVFHSVSAFCNAGFTLYPTSLERFNCDWVVLATCGTLLVAGGLGFVVIHNLSGYRFWRRGHAARGVLSMQTRTVLATTGALAALMAACVLGLEWNSALGGFSVPGKLLNALFHAVTPRSAGFHTVSMEAMGSPTLFVTIIMMFIGASPGSTGGGIKTCTLAVLIAASIAILRGREEVRLMKRSVEPRAVSEAICVTFFAALLVILVCTLLLITERGLATDSPEKGHLLCLLFETVSAFGMAGLSTGITPALTAWGRILLVLTMFAGRVGPLTLALIIMRRERPPVIHYPEESIMIG